MGSSNSISFGAQRQRAGDTDALLLAAGELVGVLVRLLREADLRQQAQRLVASLLLRPPLRDDRALDDVLQHRHVREQVVALEDHAALGAEARQDGAVRVGGEVDGHVADGDDPRVGLVERVERAQDGRLARARRPDDRRDRAGPHVERDAPQDVVVAERLADVPDGEQIGHRRTYLPSRVSSLPWKNERITQITQ